MDPILVSVQEAFFCTFRLLWKVLGITIVLFVLIHALEETDVDEIGWIINCVGLGVLITTLILYGLFNCTLFVLNQITSLKWSKKQFTFIVFEVRTIWYSIFNGAGFLKILLSRVSWVVLISSCIKIRFHSFNKIINTFSFCLLQNIVCF